jgi:hypothetical protein
MKLWIDDVRPAPVTSAIPDDMEWKVCKSVNQAKAAIEHSEKWYKRLGVKEFVIELIDIDHDAGDFASDGGDYIKLLDWLEETGRDYPIRIHSMNPVGVANMRTIIERNGWKEIK